MIEDYERYGMLAEFCAAAEAVASHWHLAATALHLARIEHTTVDLKPGLLALEGLVNGAFTSCGPLSDPDEKRIRLRRYLFEELALRGSEGARLDPHDTILTSVMERKRGIPIALSVLYMACAEAVDLPTHGIGFPGHFLVGATDTDDEVTIIDPFHGGRELAPAELLAHLGADGTADRALAAHLRPVSYPQILVRMLNNLKALYFRRGELGPTLLVLEHLCALDPGNPAFLRERGVVQERLGANEAARRDYERYLEFDPDAADVPSVLEHLRELPPPLRLVH